MSEKLSTGQLLLLNKLMYMTDDKQIETFANYRENSGDAFVKISK